MTGHDNECEQPVTFVRKVPKRVLDDFRQAIVGKMPNRRLAVQN